MRTEHYLHLYSSSTTSHPLPKIKEPLDPPVNNRFARYVNTGCACLTPEWRHAAGKFRVGREWREPRRNGTNVSRLRLSYKRKLIQFYNSTKLPLPIPSDKPRGALHAILKKISLVEISKVRSGWSGRSTIDERFFSLDASQSRGANKGGYSLAKGTINATPDAGPGRRWWPVVMLIGVSVASEEHVAVIVPHRCTLEWRCTGNVRRSRV